MNLRDQRKKYYISVKKLILFWEKGGTKTLHKILLDPNSIIERDSWVEKIKELIKKEKFLDVDQEIFRISHKFNIYKHDEKKAEDGAGNITGGYPPKSEENNSNSISGGSYDKRDPYA